MYSSSIKFVEKWDPLFQQHYLYYLYYFCMWVIFATSIFSFPLFFYTYMLYIPECLLFGCTSLMCFYFIFTGNLYFYREWNFPVEKNIFPSDRMK